MIKIFFTCINKSDMKADILEKDFKNWIYIYT